jgi:hypothetical protein
MTSVRMSRTVATMDEHFGHRASHRLGWNVLSEDPGRRGRGWTSDLFEAMSSVWTRIADV